MSINPDTAPKQEYPEDPNQPSLFEALEENTPKDTTPDTTSSTNHPGAIRVEDGGERPVEGSVKLPANADEKKIQEVLATTPDDPGTLIEGQEVSITTVDDRIDSPETQEAEALPAPLIETPVQPQTKRGNWFTDHKWLAGGVAVLAAIGLGAGVKALFGGESDTPTAKPTASSVPNPTFANTPTTAPTEATAAPTPTNIPSPTPTEAPSTTPSPETSIGADGEHVSETETIIPIADLQKIAAGNAAFKEQLLAEHPEAFEFANKRFVDHQRGAGVLSNKSIAAYLKNFTNVVSDPAFVNTAGSVSDISPENYKAFMKTDGDQTVSILSGNFDNLLFSRMRGTEEFGDKYPQLLSLDPDVVEGGRQFVANAKKAGENPDSTTFSPDVFKTLEAYNVALDTTREVTVVLAYEEFNAANGGTAGATKRMTWTAILHEPKATVSDPSSPWVFGVNFGLFDLSEK